MSKKVKIFCYKLAKPVAKKLKEELVGQPTYEEGFIKERLGKTYLFSIKKLSKGDEVILSSGSFTFNGSLKKKITHTPYTSEGIPSTDGNYLVIPGKTFLNTVDPEDKLIPSIAYEEVASLVFTEIESDEKEKEEKKMVEAIEESPKKEEEPVIETSLEDPVEAVEESMEEIPLPSIEDAPEETVSEGTLEITQEDLMEYLSTSPTSDEMSENIPSDSVHFSENPEEWFEEGETKPSYDELEEKVRELEKENFRLLNEIHNAIEEKVEKLEKENFRLSNKINNTIEEIKSLSFWDTILFRWKTKLLDILNL